jgi:hypothetical protein
MVSLGGAVGAALVGIAAPLVLPGYFELPGTLTICALLLYWQVRGQSAAYRALAVVAIVVTVFCATMSVGVFFSNALVATRNFYGVHQVQELADLAGGPYRTLIDGTTLHGTQVITADLRRVPTGYYTPDSGIGRLLSALNRRQEPLRVGVIGLGAGTLAAYGRRGDTYRFYEIDPQIIEIAKRDFSFLRDSPAATQTALGDARLTLEREAPQQFDVLVVDAFSSDAIPVHLLTFEAVALYRKHVRSGGTIAIDVSNRFLDLTGVVAGLAAAHGLRSVGILDAGSRGLQGQPSNWILLSDSPAGLALPGLEPPAPNPQRPRRDRPWTDDFNSLLPALLQRMRN